MKRILTVFIIICILFTLSACGGTRYGEYAGTWAEEDIGWEMGGMTLDIEDCDKEMILHFTLTQSAPFSREAYFATKVSVDDIKDSSVTVKFDDDCWENSGEVEITFNENYILCDFKNLVTNKLAQWGFYEETYKLVKKDNAHKLLAYNMEEYENKYGEPEPVKPTYDTSKASGILAQAGLTMSEFKNICIPLSNEMRMYYNYSYSNHVFNPDWHHLETGRNYYAQNPNDTTVELAVQEWNEICLDYQNGGEKYENTSGGGMFTDRYHLFEKYKNLDNYINDVVYASKGHQILCDNTQNIFNEMLEYPDKYVGNPFLLLGFDIYSDLGEVYIDNHYMSRKVKLYDLRDNPNNPNILSNNYYNFYVIFKGISKDGGYQYEFSVLEVEKVDRWISLTEQQ